MAGLPHHTTFPPFEIEPHHTAATRWGKWIGRFDNFLVASNITNKTRCKAMLLHYAGEEVYSIFETLPGTANHNTDSYDLAKTSLLNYFVPKRNLEYEIYTFRQARQGGNETIDQFHTRLRQLAQHCEFHDIDRETKSQIIQTCRDTELRQKILREPRMTLQEILMHGRTRESTGIQARAMECVGVTTNEPNPIYEVGSFQSYQGSYNQRSRPGRGSHDQPNRQVSSARHKTCGLCGGNYPHEVACPAKGKICHNCGKTNHFAAVCRQPTTSTNNNQPHINGNRGRSSGQYRNHATNHVASAGDNTHSQNPVETAYNLFHVGLRDRNNPYVCTVYINGEPLVMEIDTGASKSIISEKVFKTLQRGTDPPTLQDCKTTLRTYTGQLFKTLGTSQVAVTYNNQLCSLPLLVVPGQGPALLGRNWLTKLQLDWTKIHKVDILVPTEDPDPIISKFQDVFNNELGCMTGVKVQIHIDKQATPVYFKPRPVPYALRERIEAELDRLESANIIKKITHSEWAAPIVPVVKTNGEIRLCGDYKVTVNQVVTGNQYPIPKISDLYAKLAGGQTFTKFDMSDAYLQLELAEESKCLTTITTHRGLYQYNRLPFGISAAPGIFQRAMENLVQGIPHVTIYLDDILITGSTPLENQQNLSAVLQRFQDAGLRLRRDKCVFNSTSVVYLGHRIDAQGLHPLDEKVQAITGAPSPTNVQELQAYLGMLNYYGKFLPNISSILSPLHQLLRKDTKWAWTPACQRAFDSSKELLKSAKVLVHFNQKEEIVLACDASPYGIGAVISHPRPDGDRPIAYASRSLSTAERNYSQLEKEALSIIFGIKKFHQYLYGRHFTIVTDHKPLIGLFREDKAVPPTAAARIQRWALTLSAYDYNIEYKKGSEHSNADALSRLPSSPAPEDTPIPGDIIMTVNHINTTPVTSSHIATWTNHHAVLSRIKHFILTGWPITSPGTEYSPYFSRRDELTTHKGCIMWGSRVLIPPQGRQKILEELHMAHPGIVRMKGLSRSYVWWPGLDSEIEQTVRNCKSCQQHAKSPPSAPLHPWEWPGKPWYRLHIDFAGPFEGNMILIIIDAHSKFVDAHTMKAATSANTIAKLRQTFSTHGLPHIIVSDNGTNFTSQDFEDFCGRNGIHHISTAPYHPASNGLAERTVQTIKVGLNKTIGDTLEDRLNHVLFQYRITPHSTTGVPPAELLMRRRLRSRLDLVLPDVGEGVNKKQEDMKQHHDQRSKQRMFCMGDPVYARDFSHGKCKTVDWLPGVIEERSGPVSFMVRLNDNRGWRRHQDHLRYRHSELIPNDTVIITPQISAIPAITPQPTTILPPASTTTMHDQRTDSATTEQYSAQAAVRQSTRVSHPPERMDL